MKHDDMYRITTNQMATARGDVAAMGMKAHDLSRMARVRLPVPPAFVLGTPHCRQCRQDPERYRKIVPPLLDEQMHWLQSVTGLGFGDPRKPLLVSVRSGAPVSMPGMMDTLLNIGLCDATIHGLLRLTGNPRLVWDSYRRLIHSFAEVVCGVDQQPFVAAIETMLAREQADRSQELDYVSLAELSHTYLELFHELTGRPFPQQPLDQLVLAVQAVFASWNSARAVEYRRLYGLSDEMCTAVTIQQMVFGNAGGTSGSGVGFTRDPDSGAKRLYFDFLFNSQGEDVVSGRAAGSDAERLFSALPEIRQGLLAVCSALEQEFGDVQEFEFTIQDGVLYILQSRAAKRTPWAELIIAVEQVEEGLIERREALARLGGLALDEIRRQRLSPGAEEPLCQGEPAGIGVAVGPLALDVDAARKFAAEGRPAVLVREEMTTADIAGIALAAGVLAVRGSRTSHAAVVARQLDKPCVTGCRSLRLDPIRRVIQAGNRTLAEGESITLDANTGQVFAGASELVIEYPTTWLNEIRKWQHPSSHVKIADDAGLVPRNGGHRR
jgi:pyruvate,orthophosphate dikinase